MSFIQIIEYETDRADEMKALGDAPWRRCGSSLNRVGTVSVSRR